MKFLYERSLHLAWVLSGVSVIGVISHISESILMSILCLVIILAVGMWAEHIGRQDIVKSYSFFEDVMIIVMPLIIYLFSVLVLPLWVSIIGLVIGFTLMGLCTYTYYRETEDNEKFIKSPAYKPQDLWVIAWPSFALNIFTLIAAICYVVTKS